MAIHEYILHGEAWQVVEWEIALAEWPHADRWRQAVHQTLAAQLARGSRTAWIGAEGFPFCDPLQPFDPTCMTGGVLAWMTSEGFNCPLEPDLPVNPVGDERLEQLRSHSRGLADVA